MDSEDAIDSIPAICNPAPDVVTIWSDIGCPWASLAMHTLHEAAARAGVQILIDHRAFPLELFNARATPKPIIDAEIVAIAGLVPAVGWRQWTAPDGTYPATTVPALAAVQAAKDESVGGLAASAALDTGLRDAFYRDGRCISVHAEIMEVASAHETIDADALEAALRSGAGIAEVFRQWRVAAGPAVQGSPHLFTAGGVRLHNPGVEYHWTASPADGGVPRFTSYDTGWADTLVSGLTTTPPEGR